MIGLTRDAWIKETGTTEYMTGQMAHVDACKLKKLFKEQGFTVSVIKEPINPREGDGELVSTMKISWKNPK